ncbi:MAG: SMC-Scp complex subunit ScpB [Steroidobacteraceae bacterium]
MSPSQVKNVIEAALLAAGRPLGVEDLAMLFEEPLRPGKPQILDALDALGADYAERGIELKRTASGWRVQVRSELSAEISRLWPERPARYSRALLETLALIAYRQPITRGEIEAVRGVAVNPNIVKTLLERGWVRVLGQRDVPGRPELLGTTREFLDYFGLRSLDELPPLAELKAMTDLNVQLDLAEAASASDPGSANGRAGADAAATESEPIGSSDETGADPDEEAAEDQDDPPSSTGLVAAPWRRDPAPE